MTGGKLYWRVCGIAIKSWKPLAMSTQGHSYIALKKVNNLISYCTFHPRISKHFTNVILKSLTTPL